MKKGDIYEAVVEQYDFPNKGSLTLEDRKVTIKGALQGQKVRFMITKRKSGMAEGRILEVLERAPMEDAEPSCSYFGVCGGCAYRTMSYENQLALKEGMVKKLLDKVLLRAGSGSEDYVWEGILASPVQEGYRNKMEFTFGDAYKDGPLALGLHKKGSFHDILHVAGCRIIGDDWSRILSYTQEFFQEKGVPYFHRMRHDGILRNLVIRQSRATGEFLINLVTTTQWEKYGYAGMESENGGEDVPEVRNREEAAEQIGDLDAGRVVAERIEDSDDVRVAAERIGALDAGRVTAERVEVANAGRVATERIGALDAGRVAAERVEDSDDVRVATGRIDATDDGQVAAECMEAREILSDIPVIGEYVQGLLALEKEPDFSGRIAGILYTENDTLGDVVQSDRTVCLYGRDYIMEEIMELRFRISPFSFFQTNTSGCEVLYTKAREYIMAGSEMRDAGVSEAEVEVTEVEMAEAGMDVEASDSELHETDVAGVKEPDAVLHENDSMSAVGSRQHGKIVFDLYSGTGTIAQMMAPAADKVIGIEIVEEAVEAARENAKLNGLDNCEFIAGDVLKAIDLVEDKPDVIILDPPRDGINPKALEKILAFGVDEMVYISCKPTSLARDLEMITQRGYKVVKACCVDQFPMTGHVETVALLTRKVQ